MINTLLNFAILDIVQTLTKTGYIITVTTNNPCHLFMVYTLTEPEKHKRTIISRGLPVPDALAYCFVAWEENEQEEERDSFIHTFIKEPWPGCETRYFTFKGTVNGQPSPSVGPIFTKHRPLRLLFADNYNIGEWPPTYLFTDEYTIIPYPPPYSRSFTETYWGTMPPLPPELFWEPWGTYLTENNHWLVLELPDPPLISFDAGIITLNFTGTTHSGIFYIPYETEFPLVSPQNQSLCLHTNNTEVQSTNPFETIGNTIQLQKGWDIAHLQFNVYSLFQKPIFGITGGGKLPYFYWAWFFIGPGQHQLNLLNCFQQAAQAWGISPDPANWFVYILEIAHRDYAPIFQSYLKNDCIGLHY